MSMQNTQLINELNDKIEILEFQNRHLKELLKDEDEYMKFLHSYIDKQAESYKYLLSVVDFLIKDSKDLRNLIESKQTNNLKLVA